MKTTSYQIGSIMTKLVIKYEFRILTGIYSYMLGLEALQYLYALLKVALCCRYRIPVSTLSTSAHVCTADSDELERLTNAEW